MQNSKHTRTSWIKLDFDNCKKLSYRRIYRIQKVLQLLRLNKYVFYWHSEKSRKGIHLTIGISKKLANWKIGYIQALMNSDYKRECFNLLRISNNIKNWNVLFKKKIKLKLSKPQQQ